MNSLNLDDSLKQNSLNPADAVCPPYTHTHILHIAEHGPTFFLFSFFSLFLFRVKDVRSEMERQNEARKRKKMGLYTNVCAFKRGSKRTWDVNYCRTMYTRSGLERISSIGNFRTCLLLWGGTMTVFHLKILAHNVHINVQYLIEFFLWSGVK